MRTEREASDEKFLQLKETGLKQTSEYADRCSAEESLLIIFDRRDGINWNEKKMILYCCYLLIRVLTFSHFHVYIKT